MLSRLAAGALACAFVAALPFYAQSYPFSAPAGFSGHILEGEETRTCTMCHGTYPLNSGTGSVTITAPASVMPGETVPITITVDNTTPPAEGRTVRQGFLATVRDHPEPLPSDQGSVLGTLTITDAENTGRPTNGSEEFVAHTATGTSQTSWTFDWTAPAEGGAVATVYVAANAANGGGVPDNPDDGASGDYIYSTRANIAVMAVAGEARPEPLALSLAAPQPNPTRGAATVRLTLATAATVAVRLVDGRGRTVRPLASRRFPAGTHPLALATSGLAPGTYFVVAEADGARQTQPLVVAR